MTVIEFSLCWWPKLRRRVTSLVILSIRSHCVSKRFCKKKRNCDGNEKLICGARNIFYLMNILLELRFLKQIEYSAYWSRSSWAAYIHKVWGSPYFAWCTVRVEVEAGVTRVNIQYPGEGWIRFLVPACVVHKIVCIFSYHVFIAMRYSFEVNILLFYHVWFTHLLSSRSLYIIFWQTKWKCKQLETSHGYCGYISARVLLRSFAGELRLTNYRGALLSLEEVKGVDIITAVVTSALFFR